MTCESAAELLESYFDDELDPQRAADLREHLGSCEDCAAKHARLLALRMKIQTQAPYYKAPAHLEGRLREALRKEAASRAAPPWRWMAIAACALLALSGSWNVALLRSRSASVEQEVISSHVRSLIGTHLLDVPSSDQHTVKPWFNGKLDFSPDVRDFAPQGFPLEGGRIEYIAGRRVAVLVYRRRQHVINLLTWPGGGAGSGLTQDGYHLQHWSKGGMTYWAVSDVNAQDLMEFRKLF